MRKTSLFFVFMLYFGFVSNTDGCRRYKIQLVHH